MARAEVAKTYKATLRGVPSVSFEIYMRYVSPSYESADVTINPKAEAKQIGGFDLGPYELVEVVAPITTRKFALVDHPRGIYNPYILLGGIWYELIDNATPTLSAVPEDDVRFMLKGDKMSVVYER